MERLKVMIRGRKLNTLDPIQILGTKRAFGLFSMAWVFACLFIASGKASTAGNPGMGGADRIGVGVLGLSESGNEIPEDEPLCYSAYSISQGDSLSKVAERFNVTLDTIVSFNNIKNARNLRAGQTLKIPSQSGIVYQAKAGDTVAALAKEYDISGDRIIEANGLFSESIQAEKRLFLPDARLSSFYLREVSGELFRYPLHSFWLSSYFGWRKDPFSGVRSFHNGLDMAASYGSPIYAAMEGRVVDAGYSTVLGNYIGISHHSGYQTFYGHLSKKGVSVGQYVNLGQYIGNVGSTGYSTGDHLHFSVLKWGRSVNPLIVTH